MKFISTRNHHETVSFEYALLHGLAPDGGLYSPALFPNVNDSLFQSIGQLSLHGTGKVIMGPFLNEIPPEVLQSIIASALDFPIPLVHLEDNLYLLEAFHGPTLAFKDVGARFMANTLSYLAAAQHRKISIVVATSGDTGSAIANAFYQTPNIDVYILYPSNKISRLQEQQITTFGGNIHALEVAGTFDDCQHLVKTALSDDTLRHHDIITTANSINIARLLPQMIYHVWGLIQLRQLGINEIPALSVPSGNLGNLTSAVFAKSIGFDIRHLIAATNINTVFPDYLQSSKFNPQPSQKSLANAMDVGNPSNFERLLDHYDNDCKKMCRDISGIVVDDDGILSEIKHTYQNTGYILDPHTAVGVAAARKSGITNAPVIITATAHPAKFPEVITKAIHIDIPLPGQLQLLLNKPKKSEGIGIDYADFYTHLS